MNNYFVSKDVAVEVAVVFAKAPLYMCIMTSRNYIDIFKITQILMMSAILLMMM